MRRGGERKAPGRAGRRTPLEKAPLRSGLTVVFFPPLPPAARGAARSPLRTLALEETTARGPRPTAVKTRSPWAPRSGGTPRSPRR